MNKLLVFVVVFFLALGCSPKDEIVDFDNPKAAVVEKEGTQLGVIAQEIQTILPDVVTEQSTGVLSVSPDNITWYLVNAVKELSAKVKALEDG